MCDLLSQKLQLAALSKGNKQSCEPSVRSLENLYSCDLILRSYSRRQ